MSCSPGGQTGTHIHKGKKEGRKTGSGLGPLTVVTMYGAGSE